MLRRLWRKVGRASHESAEPEITWVERAVGDLPSCLPEVVRHARSNDPLVAVGLALLEVEARDDVWPRLVPADAGSEDSEGFARAWAALALDNDALPPRKQLTRAELEHARALLAAFFFAGQQLNQRASTVLQMIEERFNRASFGQSSLLLQLFDTDEATRRSNERNLFFERMSHTMLQRRTSLASGLPSELRELSAELAGTGADRTPRLLAWLDRNAGVRLHLRLHAPATADLSSEPGISADAIERLRTVLPHARWRSAHLGEQPLTDRVIEHLGCQPSGAHLRRLLTAAYFITLATGRTGHERLVIDLVRWISERHQTIGTRLLPDLHRRWSVNDQPMDEAVDDILRTHMGDSPWSGGTFSPEAVRDALSTVSHRLAQVDLHQVPEGDYDLGGLVQDVLTNFPDSGIERALRIHRLT